MIVARIIGSTRDIRSPPGADPCRIPWRRRAQPRPGPRGEHQHVEIAGGVLSASPQNRLLARARQYHIRPLIAAKKKFRAAGESRNPEKYPLHRNKQRREDQGQPPGQAANSDAADVGAADRSRARNDQQQGERNRAHMWVTGL